MVIQKTVDVSKEADELASALVAMVAAVKDALADGWQAGTDIPMIVTKALTVLGPAVDGMEKLGAEKDENLAAFVRALGLAGMDVAAIFLKKEEVVAPVA
jgi:hypothetical protein